VNQRNIARYRRALEAARAQLNACDHNAGSLAMERTSDSTEEWAMANERDLALDRLERRVFLLHQVENALGRIAVGEYGACVGCREPISEKRLVALPWAALCLTCQEAADNRNEPRAEATLARSTAGTSEVQERGALMIPLRECAASVSSFKKSKFQIRKSAPEAGTDVASLSSEWRRECPLPRVNHRR
jgi:DnaK suppressor protein